MFPYNEVIYYNNNIIIYEMKFPKTCHCTLLDHNTMTEFFRKSSGPRFDLLTLEQKKKIIVLPLVNNELQMVEQ